jgi:hypothetical protein
MASFKRKTMERTAGDHQCRGQVEVDADGDGVNEGNALRGAAVVAHMPTGNAAERQSTTIRRIGNHVICQSRLNYANFAASPFYLVDFSADTDGGSEVIIDIPIGPLLPVYGPVPFAGGTLIMELGTPPGALPAPSVDVRFDFAGQASGSPASCATLITTLTGLGPVLDDSTTITIGSGI